MPTPLQHKAASKIMRSSGLYRAYAHHVCYVTWVYMNAHTDCAVCEAIK